MCSACGEELISERRKVWLFSPFGLSNIVVLQENITFET